MSGDVRALENLLAALPDGGERFAVACNGVRRWRPLYARAVQHRVHAVIADAVLDHRVELPPGLADAMTRDLGAQCLWQAHLRAEIDRVLETLYSAGIATCVLKGPVFAERVYRSVELRPTTDIDLLVEPQDLDRAIGTLCGIGLNLEEPGEFGPHPFERRMCGPSGIVIEIHFRAQVSFGTALDARDLLGDAREYLTEGGARCLVASPEDEFVYLAMHAANHGFDRLLMLYDLKLLCEASPGFNWARVAELAHARKLEAMVAFTCDLLGERLEMQLPPMRRLGNNRPAVRKLLRGIERAPYVPLATGFATSVLRGALYDSPAEGRRYLRQHVLAAVGWRVARARRRLSGE